MTNAMSRIAPEAPTSGGQPSLVLQIVMGTFARAIANKEDLLGVFPTEIRLLIFKELLTVSKTVFRGARDFGPLDVREFDGEEVRIPWQILLTCRQYNEEAAPFMYSQNKLVFCTGAKGTPGMFLHFPVHRQYMRYLFHVGIYFRADAPKKHGSQCVAQFIMALTKRAKNLNELVVMAASDRYYERVCPWDIIFGNHPVALAVEKMVMVQAVRYLQLRVHDGAKFYYHWAHYMAQTFYQNGGANGRGIGFARSCSCPPTIYFSCPVCLFPTDLKHLKPIVWWVHPWEVEANERATMDLQDDLFALGLLPGDDDEEGEQEDECDRFTIVSKYERNRLGFSSRPPFGEDTRKWRKWRGVVKAPKVWRFRQMRITEFLMPVEYDEYLETVFGWVD